MYIHAYDDDLNYLGVKEAPRATVSVQEEFEKELLLKYPNATISFGVEPTEREMDQEPSENLPF